MKPFRHIVLVSALAMATNIGVAVAQSDATTYSQAIKACGAEWKASEDRKADKSMAAWQKFRATCVTRQGWKPKKAVAQKAD